MEESRLKPMQEGYDQELFLEIYESTHNLRRKLTSQIDPKRFGVDRDEIMSWFDVKFLHAFNRYFGQKSPGILKAHIIRSLQFFKNRILRHSYSQKNSVNNNCIDITELYALKEPIVEYEYDEREFFLGIATEFMRNHLSEQAFIVLQVELKPPLYILERLGNASTAKIPSNLISDYLGMGTDRESIRQINALRKEIKNVMETAKDQLVV